MEQNIKGAGLHRNTLSYFGVVVILISSALILATLLWSYSIKSPSPYLGIFTFLVFPLFLFFGIFLFIFGILLESRRRKKYKASALPYPIVDLNNPRHRKKFNILVLTGTFLAILFGFIGYNGFIFTESVTFCGKICHKVMEPEYKAYLKSPHARVTCVECHVGKGASWYVKSKLSGLRQVWAVTFNKYPKPIPTPIKNLRPARETCEECHWPQKFYGFQFMELYHFRYNEKNTEERINLILKTGGGTKIEKNAGIHWHMLLQNKVYFKALDEKQQIIPYIKTVKEDGSSRIYIDKTLNLKNEEIEKLKTYEMDCMDCHNRPTHIFDPPEKAVDKALAGGHISKELPFVKKISVDLLVKDYKSKEEAEEKIKEEFLNFYQKNYPTILRDKKEEIYKAISVLQELFKTNIFPEMNVNWNTYANNIGHRNWPGCFRCHNDNHTSEDGKKMSTECDICHTMPQRISEEKTGGNQQTAALPWHPMELKGKHSEILCYKCHEAGKRSPLDCAECHKINKEDPMILMGCDTCHIEEGRKLPQNDCSSCHSDLKGTHKLGGHPDLSCIDCHKQHKWKVDTKKDCFSCHSGYEKHSQGLNCINCHSFK
jgi:hypothetical protein